MRAHWKVGAIWFAIFIAILAVVGFLLVWSGVYSVAASRGHFPGFKMFLEFAMRSSVRTHALGIEIPNLEEQALIERGAGHFQGGCAPCHGAPGRPPSSIVRAMLPEPPDLGATVPTWKANELFWIVKNGLKYTGMPSWAAEQRDDEVWAVVAFLRRLPNTSAAEYQALANLEPRQQETPIRSLAQGGPVGTGLAACSRCHGLDGAGRPSGAFPRLDIQTPDYLLLQLEAYADGTRHSGIMQPVAAELEKAEMRRLADYYSSKSSVLQEKPSTGVETLRELGEKLAMVGLPEQGIPACLSCHTEDPAARDPLYPALAGQYASHTIQQLELYKTGRRRATPAAVIMAVIAERLTAEHIKAVSVYLSSLPPARAEP